LDQLLRQSGRLLAFEFSAFSAATVWMVGFGLATLDLHRSGMPMPLPL